MKKRIFALFLALSLLLSLLVLIGCNDETAQPQNSDEENQAQTSTEENQAQPSPPDDMLTVLLTCTETQMLKYRAIYEETGYNPVVDASNYSEEEKVYKNVTINLLYAAGFGKYKTITLEEFEKIQKYQNETGKQVIYPLGLPFDRIDYERKMAKTDINNANIYYKTKTLGGKTVMVLTENGEIIPNYWKGEVGNPSDLALPYNSLRIEGEEGIEQDGKNYHYYYGWRVDGGVEVRVFQYAYYQYLQATNPDSLPPQDQFFLELPK